MPFLGQLPVGTGNAGENLGHVAAIVSVLEEGNVELGTDGEQEALEGGGPLGKGKHEELLVGHAGAAAAEVANVALGELVGGEVGGGHGAVLADAFEQTAQLVGALDGGGSGEGDADEDVGDVAALGVAVGELGDGAGHDGLDEAGKGAGPLGDAAGEQHLLALAEGGALGDKAQAVKVHVGARGDGDEGRDVDEPVGGGAAGALVLGGVKVGAVQDDVAAEAGDVGVLDARCALGHDDGGGNLELAGRVGDALRVVAGGAADDALPGPRGVEVGHFVVGAAQLEAKDGLLVLALEQHGALEPVAEVDGVGEGRGLAGFVDARCGGEDHA
ncbi:hypothetical protein HC256_003406 [Beauveria bassiana]|nr:hypothetical protein HC256_003406 [Beauveria bassiana]